MFSADEAVTVGRIAAVVLAVVAAVSALGVVVVLLLGATGLEAAVLLGTLVLSTLGILLVVSHFWQSYTLVRLRDEFHDWLKGEGRRER